MLNYHGMFRFVYQKDDFSCGKACVQMVLYHFKVRPLSNLQRLLKTNENGTYQKNIIHAIKKHGLKIRIVQSKRIYVSARKDLAKGCLLILCVDDNLHWIVVRKMTKKTVYIADPDMVKGFQRIKNFKKRFANHSYLAISKG